MTPNANGTEAVLAKLGYPALVVVEGRLSIADLYPSKAKRCGIYVLEHADGMHYIGQAIDVVRRYAQHRKLIRDIVRFSFFRTSRRALNDEETRCIQGAESRGLRLRNRVLVKQLLVETDLDDVLDPTEQQAWLKSRAGFHGEVRLLLDPEQLQRARFRPQFERFKAEPEFEQVVTLLRTYIGSCVPVPRRTELSFWSVSCLPATNHSHHPRWAAVNIAEMEVFVVGWTPKSREPWAFMNLSRSVLGEREIARLKLRGSGFECSHTGYRAAGGDDLTLSTRAGTFTAMSKALMDPALVRATRSLNLQVMRKRPNWYAKFHCFDLADRLL